MRLEAVPARNLINLDAGISAGSAGAGFDAMQINLTGVCRVWNRHGSLSERERMLSFERSVGEGNFVLSKDMFWRGQFQADKVTEESMEQGA